MPDVVVENLEKRFGTNTVLKENTFTIRDGEFFTLLGPSGCGKSTTLNCIAGLERPTGGRITVGGATFVDADRKVFLIPEERNLGMVFQSYALWPHMTVSANLAMPLKIRKVGKVEQTRRIDEALEKVGLAHLQDRYPHQLSGGQQQRVALARALVYSPSVLLLDEPLSNLDAKLREQARAWLKRLQTDLGITTVTIPPVSGTWSRTRTPPRPPPPSRHPRNPRNPRRRSPSSHFPSMCRSRGPFDTPSTLARATV